MKKVKIKIKRLHPNATLPKQASEFAGGWDVTATEIIQQEDRSVICKLGFALDIPKGYKLTIVPRSSLTKTTWVMQNSPGLGDADYRGEYQARFRAIPTGMVILPFPYNVGDRIAQVYLEEVIDIEFEEVENLENTERSDGGFGSTGK